VCDLSRVCDWSGVCDCDLGESVATSKASQMAPSLSFSLEPSKTLIFRLDDGDCSSMRLFLVVLLDRRRLLLTVSSNFRLASLVVDLSSQHFIIIIVCVTQQQQQLSGPK